MFESDNDRSIMHEKSMFESDNDESDYQTGEILTFIRSPGRYLNTRTESNGPGKY